MPVLAVPAAVRLDALDQTTANQERELREIAGRMGCEIVKVYRDHGISGAKGRDKRPAFDKLCRDAARREFEMVMAWSVDRLGRSLQDLVGFLSELHALKIDLFLRQQGLDTTTPAGKAMFQMMGVFAEFERAMIAERVRAGLARARSEGKRLGRPPIAPARRWLGRARLRQRTHGSKNANAHMDRNITRSLRNLTLRPPRPAKENGRVERQAKRAYAWDGQYSRNRSAGALPHRRQRHSLEFLGLFCYAERSSVVRNGNLGIHWSLGLQSNAVEKRTIRQPTRPAAGEKQFADQLRIVLAEPVDKNDQSESRRWPFRRFGLPPERSLRARHSAHIRRAFQQCAAFCGRSAASLRHRGAAATE